MDGDHHNPDYEFEAEALSSTVFDFSLHRDTPDSKAQYPPMGREDENHIENKYSDELKLTECREDESISPAKDSEVSGAGSQEKNKYFYYEAPHFEDTGVWIPVSIPPMLEMEHEDHVGCDGGNVACGPWEKMQRMREKLAISDRTAKAEAQLKEKLKLRLKTLEEGLKHVSSFSVNPYSFCRSPKTEKSSNFLGFLTSPGGLGKRSTSQPRASSLRSSPLRQPNSDNETAKAAGEIKKSDSFKRKYSSGEKMLKKSLWASRTKVVDSGEMENTEGKADNNKNDDKTVSADIKTKDGADEDSHNKISINCETEDVVSGFLYDRLQKEVINLRRHCEVKPSDMNAKEQEIKMLMKKVDALTKAMEVESKKMKREAIARDKEAALPRWMITERTEL